MTGSHVTTYLVKELFGPTLQGEGAHAGTPCVFLRFAVCNLACSWCDTDFAPEGARKMAADDIGDELVALDIHGSKLVVVTGGEPTLQWDQPIAAALKKRGFRIHMESNGTRLPGGPVDWLTVSPKPQFHEGRFALDPRVEPSECKVVVDDSVDLELLQNLQERYPKCAHWFLQPCDSAQKQTHLEKTLALLTRLDGFRLSVQLHKVLGLP